jgi:putative MATE family efflux protein
MLANESIGRLLFRLSLPAGIGMFVMALYNVVDTIFIGHAVGSLGIAGLSIVFPVQILVMGIGQLIGMGGASLISRALGARHHERAARSLGNAVTSVIVLGGLLTVVGLSNSSFWLRLFGASDTVLPYAKDYLDIILLGTVFRTFAMAANGLVRAEGNARVPMIAMIIGAILNIALDAVLIMGFGMGMRGAAIATALSQVVTSIYLTGYYVRGNSSLRLRPGSFLPDVNIMKEMFAVGLGSFARTAAGSVVTMVINRIAGVYGGDLGIAAYGLANRMMMFVFMPLISIAQGLQPILGFSYGARRFDRALSSLRLAIIAATVFSTIGFIVLFVFPSSIVRVFSGDVALIEASSHATRLIFSAAYLVGFQIIGSMTFQTIGRALPTFITATSRHVLFLLPLLFLLPRFMGLDGIWLSFPIAEGLSFTLTLVLVIPLIRQFRRAIGHAPRKSER